MVWRNLLLVGLLCVGGLRSLHAQDAAPVEGSLQLGGKTIKLAHAVAYEGKLSGDDVLTILASDRPISADKVKTVLKEGKGKDDDLTLTQPHLRIRFTMSGEPTSYYAFANGTTVSSAGGSINGELKRDGDRVQGKATLELTGEGSFERRFDVRFNVALLESATSPPAAKPATRKTPMVSGRFKGNGKDAKIAFASARAGEPFADKPSIVLIFTELDHSKDKRPDISAGFGRFGSAIIISCHEDGNIFGCEVAHAAHAKKPFSSIGKVTLDEFDASNGQAAGVLNTGGETETFGEKWEVNLKFVVDLPASAPKPSVADAPKPTPKPTVADTPKPREPKAAASLKVRELPYPKDAKEFEYKEIVKHVAFRAPGGVKAVADEFAKSLDGQGWAKKGGDLVTPASAILNRTKGDAKLTIFVKPADGGSQVTIFTEGLDWKE
jgi:hypothetical protein